jgi:hypothetical protein
LGDQDGNFEFCGNEIDILYGILSRRNVGFHQLYISPGFFHALWPEVILIMIQELTYSNLGENCSNIT